MEIIRYVSKRDIKSLQENDGSVIFMYPKERVYETYHDWTKTIPIKIIIPEGDK